MGYINNKNLVSVSPMLKCFNKRGSEVCHNGGGGGVFVCVCGGGGYLLIYPHKILSLGLYHENMGLLNPLKTGRLIVEDLRKEGDIISCKNSLHNRMLSVSIYFVIHILRLGE